MSVITNVIVEEHNSLAASAKGGRKAPTVATAGIIQFRLIIFALVTEATPLRVLTFLIKIDEVQAGRWINQTDSDAKETHLDGQSTATPPFKQMDTLAIQILTVEPEYLALAAIGKMGSRVLVEDSRVENFTEATKVLMRVAVSVTREAVTNSTVVSVVSVNVGEILVVVGDTATEVNVVNTPVNNTKEVLSAAEEAVALVPGTFREDLVSKTVSQGDLQWSVLREVLAVISWVTRGIINIDSF
jgi:hypothetical protein